MCLETTSERSEPSKGAGTVQRPSGWKHNHLLLQIIRPSHILLCYELWKVFLLSNPSLAQSSLALLEEELKEKHFSVVHVDATKDSEGLNVEWTWSSSCLFTHTKVSLRAIWLKLSKASQCNWQQILCPSIVSEPIISVSDKLNYIFSPSVDVLLQAQNAHLSQSGCSGLQGTPEKAGFKGLRPSQSI